VPLAMPTNMERLKRSLERGPARWLAVYALLGVLGGVLVAALKHAYSDGPDLLWRASRAIVPSLLVGLWIGSWHWDFRIYRYERWLASTARSSPETRGAVSPGHGDTDVIRLSPRHLAGWLSLTLLILWLGVPAYVDHLHDRRASSIFADRVGEAEVDARRLLVATWLCSDRFSVATVSDAHIALGLGCLERNEVPEARQQLLEAARTSTLPRLTPIGLSQYLIRGLLERGEDDAVVAFLAACRVKEQGANRDLDHWIAQVRLGERPEFGPVLR
jgi:hypothetical protein